MKHRNLIVGLIIAFALAGGIYLAYSARKAAGEGPLPGSPDVTKEDGAFVVDGITVQVKIGARPIKADEKTRYLFLFEGAGGEALTLEEGVVSFTMKMDMGRHPYELVPDGADGWYAAEASIPRCPSGDPRWYGNMEFFIDGTSHKGGFQFDLAP